ncbi:type II CAAX prenyl endopeptidase Rce1 family protein [Actinomadura sp. 3N508]|uniref:CPBP family glutamic-type intramembrane protease n=1 Tax=Actinomadura sp. 3N508 TaxID=3375153 RepID=UPI00379F481F
MTRSPLALAAAVVVVVLFGTHFATALNDFAELAGVDIDWPGLPVPVNLPAANLTAAGIWLLFRIRHPAHNRTPGSSATGLAAWCAAGLTIAGLALLPHLGQAADTAATVLLAGAGAWLCAAVAADVGAPLWRGRLPGEIVRRWDITAITACTVMLAGQTTSMLWGEWIAQLGPAETDQANATGLPNPVLFATQALVAGLREEIPLLAMPAVLMAAARRPAWQILLVVCALRAVPHAYLGAPALATIVFAAAAWWMYRATGRIGPIIVGHTLYNATILFGGAPGRLMLLATIPGAVLLLLHAPKAAPTWLRRWIQDKPARDRPVKAKGPAL